jgi:hypothetical protein
MSEQPVMYGNWRKRRGIGLGSLSTGQSVTLAGCTAAVVAALNATPQLGMAAVGVAAVVATVALIPVGPQSLGEWIAGRIRFSRARSSGELTFDAGLLTDHPRTADLPGAMAPLVPLSSTDGRGGRQTLLWDRLTGRLTAVLRVAPVGIDLADKTQADMWVASFGALLAELGYHPMVKHLSVTIDTAPSGGVTTREYVASRLDPHAPAGARRVMAELVAASPAASADTDAWVAVTCDPTLASPRPTDLLGAVAEVTRILPTLEARLASCGVSVLGRADIAWLAHRLRVAYDPTANRVAPLAPDSLDDLGWWAEAGPVAAQEEWDRWRHDTGTSVAWAWAEAPRKPVLSRVLTPLLAPGPWPRRVTLLYEPYSAAEAAAQVEREVTASSFRQAIATRTRRDPTQRDLADQQRATQAAQEEAAGAGVLRFTMYITTTVLQPEHLEQAVSDVEQRGGQCGIRLRRQTRGHAGGFVAALGMGVNPAAQTGTLRRDLNAAMGRR